MTDRTASDRWVWAWLVALVVLAATLIVAWTPWHVDFGPRTSPARVGEFFSPAEVARSDAYFAAARWPAWIGTAVALVVPVALACSPLGRRWTAAVCQRVRRWWLQVPLLVGVILVVTTLAGLVTGVWSSAVARDYGLVTQPWGGWLRDQAVGLGVSWLLTSLGLLVLVGCARRWRRWYVGVGLAAGAATVVLSLLYPYVIEPLTMPTHPMPPGPTRTALLAMARDDGVDLSQVLVADASSRTTAENAYVSGFGPSRRLVVYDTLLRRASPAETRVVVAHELGHAKFDDVGRGTVVGAVAVTAGVTGLGLLLSRRRVLRVARADAAGDPRVVPTVIAVAAVVSFLALPVADTMSRQIESRADLHSLQLTRDPDTFIDMQRNLARSNLSHLTPNPVLEFWFSTHPGTMERIDDALAWRAGHERGETR